MKALFNKGADKNVLLKYSKISANPPKHLTQNNSHNKSFWYKVKIWLFPYFIKSKKLSKQFLEAKIKQEENIARKIEAETNLLNVKGAREYNSIINEIFSDDGLPEEAKALKLAKLLENNHNIKSLLKSSHETTNQQK